MSLHEKSLIDECLFREILLDQDVNGVFQCLHFSKKNRKKKKNIGLVLFIE